MRKIAAYFLHNVGFKHLWFMRHYVACSSPVSHVPVHTIIGAGNGSGKSTTISLLFSLLVPAQDRFLRTQKDPNYAFEDYFDGHYYRPGFVVIEFDAGPLETSRDEEERNRILVGQMVCRSQPGSDAVYRRFFSFRAAAGLSMKTLLEGDGEIAPLESLTDPTHCKEWLKVMRARAPKEHPASFYDTDKQQEWIQHLSGAWGIDHTLSLLQWRYNRREGGVEVKEANSFADYRDFLRRFMDMCLNESAVSALKKNIESNIKNLSDVPRFEEQLDVFRSMQKRFEPFRLAAQKLREATHDRDNELRTARGLSVALTRQVEALQVQQDAHERRAASFRERATTAETARHEAEARLRGLEKARHEAEIRDRHTAYEAALAVSRRAEVAVNVRMARKALIDIDAYEADIAESERQFALANAELKEFQDHAKEAGARYRSALNSHRAALLAGKSRKERLVRCLASAKSVLATRAETLGKEKDALTKDVARISAQQEQGATLFKRLVVEGLIRQNETGSGALKRLAGELTERQEAERTASAAITATEERIKAVRQETANRDKECAGLKREAEEHGREYARGRATADELVARLYQSGVVDTLEANPESPLVQGRLNDCRDLFAEKSATLAMEKGTLENDRTSVERFEVLGVDHNVAGVTRALVNAGFDAMPYGSYLAGILAENPEAARAVFLSDPARFSGVQVLDQAALEAASSLTGLALDRPVVVSLGTDKIAAPDSDSVVVGHEGHAFYNKPAAQAFKDQLDGRIASLERSRAEVLQESDNIAGCQALLASYLSEFGSGKLEALKSHEQQLRKRAASLAQWLHEAEKTRTDLEAHLAEQRAAHTKLVSAINALGLSLRRVQEYVEDVESKKEQWEREKEELNRTRATLDARLQRHRDSCARVDESLSRFRREADTLQGDIKLIDHLLSTVTLYSDESFDVGTDYEPLGKIYEAAYGALKDKEDGKARDLSRTLKTLRTELHKKRAEYTKAYGDHDEAEVRAVAVAGLDSQIRTAEETLAHARRAGAEAKSSLDAATGAFTQDIARWKQSGLGIVDANLDAAISLDALAKLMHEAREAIDIAARDLDEAVRDARDEEKRATRAGKDRLCFAEAKALVEGATAQLADLEGILDADVASPALDMALSVAKSQQERLARGIRTVQAFAEQAQRGHGMLMRFLESEDVRQAAPYESSLMLQAGRTNYEAFVADADDKARIITDRITMLEDNIAKSEEGLHACAKALARGVEQGLRLLKHAVNFRVPDTVPFLGGQRVLKIGSLDRLTKSNIPLEEHLKSFIKRLVADGGTLPGGDRLVADAICHVAERMAIKINVRILKPVPALGRYDHVDISSYNSSSGGEGLTSALMYYLLAADIRSREQGRDANFGGALILDNPVGEANLAMLLQAQREIATSLGIQLIYFTGIKDMESMSEFNHHVSLRASQKEDRQSGRRYMEVWSMEVQPGTPGQRPNLEA